MHNYTIGRLLALGTFILVYVTVMIWSGIRSKRSVKKIPREPERPPGREPAPVKERAIPDLKSLIRETIRAEIHACVQEMNGDQGTTATRTETPPKKAEPDKIVPEEPDLMAEARWHRQRKSEANTTWTRSFSGQPTTENGNGEQTGYTRIVLPDGNTVWWKRKDRSSHLDKDDSQDDDGVSSKIQQMMDLAADVESTCMARAEQAEKGKKDPEPMIQATAPVEEPGKVRKPKRPTFRQPDHKHHERPERASLEEMEKKISRKYKEVLNQVKKGATTTRELMAGLRAAIRQESKLKNLGYTYAMGSVLYGDEPLECIFEYDSG